VWICANESTVWICAIESTVWIYGSVLMKALTHRKRTLTQYQRLVHVLRW
jgi:hypothetical protein